MHSSTSASSYNDNNVEYDLVACISHYGGKEMMIINVGRYLLTVFQETWAIYIILREREDNI